jgi:ankyrin repeat protein
MAEFMRQWIERWDKKIGQAPLHLAAAEGRTKTVESLLKDEGYDVDSVDDLGNTPLFYASLGGYEDVVQLLLETDADVNHTNENGSPLHAAALGGHEEMVALLLKSGAVINAQDCDGHTPLYVAVPSGI